LAPGFSKYAQSFAQRYGFHRLLATEHLAVVVDVGANWGDTLLALNATGCPPDLYIAVEPDPNATKALQRNVARNTVVEQRCVIHPVAVAAEPSDGVLFAIDTRRADSSFDIRRGMATARVQVCTLDQLLEETTQIIDLLKIETEGFEAEALQGASRVLQRTRYVAVDAGAERRGRVTLPAVLDILGTSGFRMLWASPPPHQTFLFSKVRPNFDTSLP
jgi:FkbM family methyltransferase